MSTLLVVCVGCARHVRVTDPRCPFCGALVVVGEAPSLELPRGASRAVIAALGASLSFGAHPPGVAHADPPRPHVEAHPTIAAPYGAPPRPPPPRVPPAVSSLEWFVTLPARIRMRARAATRLEISATNRSLGLVRPERHRLRLLVNGAPSQVFGVAFGNGGVLSDWINLPPGRTARDARMILEALLPAPGEYQLVLEWAGHVVARRVVTVTP